MRCIICSGVSGHISFYNNIEFYQENELTLLLKQLFLSNANFEFIDITFDNPVGIYGRWGVKGIEELLTPDVFYNLPFGKNKINLRIFSLLSKDMLDRLINNGWKKYGELYEKYNDKNSKQMLYYINDLKNNFDKYKDQLMIKDIIE